ncbi:MAG: site-specific DNA-methyltransferase (adenine-specific) [Lachnoclostridium sp.]
MADTGLFNNVYNPDVLSCLANLSNDEVFTPPDVVNAMLDMLPQELFQNPDTTFLDPACKTGVFLREIAKRLIKGLEPQFPDLQERIDHIFHKQLFGIAITELTSLLSRRSVYCSKYPNSEFSVSYFDDAQGNIRFKNIKHTWKDGKCIYCGISKKTVLGDKERGETLEAHAYEWIHTFKPEEIFNMKFDVIISNPPYQLNDGGAGASAKPIYNLFVEQAKKLNPRFLTMIIPSRWFAGGKGLDDFRRDMLTDRRIVRIVDYVNAKDCFSGISLGGGVCYFLWDRDNPGKCYYTNIHDGKESSSVRDLDEFDVFVRYNEAVSIIHKVASKNEKKVSEFISTRNPFGLSSSVRGDSQKQSLAIKVYSSAGTGYISRDMISQGKDNIEKYKILISKVTSEHAGEPDKSGMFKVISRALVLAPNEVCTDSYLIAFPTNNKTEAENFYLYLCTKFFRFLLLQSITSINLSKDKFSFIPMQDFSKPWTDKELYEKYELTSDEINFIESMIKPMDGGDESGN